MTNQATDDHAYLIPVEEEGGHGADALGSGCVSTLVHIHFQEDGSRELGRQLLEERGDSLARRTPTPYTLNKVTIRSRHTCNGKLFTQILIHVEPLQCCLEH